MQQYNGYNKQIHVLQKGYMPTQLTDWKAKREILIN